METLVGLVAFAALVFFLAFDVFVTEKQKRLEIEEKQKFHSELLEILKRGDK